MLQIQSPSDRPTSPHPVLNLGFRIFFSGGAIFAMITMVLWIMVFMGKTNIEASRIHPFFWHAHEMLYGYAVAIIAGFLLTAVKTWTGVMMPYGKKLAVIFLFWLLARFGVIMLGLGIGYTAIWLTLSSVSDLIFMGLTAYTITKAVLSVKQYKQMGIISKLVLLTIGNMVYYFGVFTKDMELQRVAVYLGLYLVLGIVLTIGRRVVPFFIERGLSFDSNKEVTVKNSKFLDALSLLSFLVFMIADVFFPDPNLVTISAGTVAVVNILRLMGWYKHRIWQKPLLWSLFLAFAGMCIAFVLFALQPWSSITPWLSISHSVAVHALALSGIGMMTVAMMSRVSLGHTGRSIHSPPKTVNFIFAFMVMAFVFRVIMPMVSLDYYVTWIMVAQLFWVLSFGLFCFSYLPILFKARDDGLFG